MSDASPEKPIVTFNLYGQRVEESRYPTCDGWWARLRGGTVEWFDVATVENERGGAAYLGIYVDDVENFIPVEQFNSPLTRWYGPILVPSMIES